MKQVFYILKTARPHQWVKNLFIFPPLLFSEEALSLPHLLSAIVAALAFSFLSSSVYILNDLVDKERDSHHPVKKDRPIASGKLGTKTAILALVGFLLLAFGLGLWLLPLSFTWVGLGYLGLNVAYSWVLKHLPFLDVMSIAFGFILRLWAGALAIGVPLTPWIFVTTFLLASFLALGKRRHELLSSRHVAKQRKVLARYHLETVTVVMRILALGTFLSYVAYCFFGGEEGHLFQPRQLIFTSPCVVFGLWRFETLVARSDTAESPTDLMLRDWPFLLNLGLWALGAGIVIYVN